MGRGIKDIAQRIEHTLLRPDATAKDIENLCNEARRYAFWAVCVNPSWVSLARRLLYGSEVRVCTVIGFPIGAALADVKIFEAIRAVEEGADELDMVMNIGLGREGRWDLVRKEVEAFVLSTPSAVHKVIIETGLFDESGIRDAAKSIADGGAQFVKTSTGFGPRGATLRDIKVIRSVIGPGTKIKAAGGIRTIEEVTNFLGAGAERIGTSSGVGIMEGISRQ